MKSVVISNTGPIIALSGVNHLEVLSGLYADILVPDAVDKEIKSSSHDSLGLNNYMRATWIKVMSPRNVEPLLRTQLDAGEAAVIDLALKKPHADVLIDERKGRKIARLVYGMSVLGTIRILMNAKDAGLIPGIKEIIQQMRTNGYWIHDSIVDHALQIAGEK